MNRIKCPNCPHPAHIGQCSGRMGQTAYKCHCRQCHPELIGNLRKSNKDDNEKILIRRDRNESS